MTTLPFRRTLRIVVERIFLCIFKPLFQHSDLHRRLAGRDVGPPGGHARANENN
jgi:hypothetical protein